MQCGDSGFRLIIRRLEVSEEAAVNNNAKPARLEVRDGGTSPMISR